MQEGEFKTLIADNDAEPTPLDIELWTRLGKPKRVALREPAAYSWFTFVFNAHGRCVGIEAPAINFYRTDSPRIPSPANDGTRRWM